MKVFISWSGPSSQKVALAMRGWLPTVIQAIDPWMSSEDIPKGESWLTQITEALAGSKGVGLFCVTPENTNSPWLNFEAGVIAAADRSRVVTFLHGVKPVDLPQPLGMFQATESEKQNEVLKLLESLNNRLSNPLSQTMLQKAFETFWPTLQKELKEIQRETIAPTQARNPQDKMDEILETVRRIERLQAGALESNPISARVTREKPPTQHIQAAGLSDWESSFRDKVIADEMKRYQEMLTGGVSKEDYIAKLTQDLGAWGGQPKPK